MGLALIQTGTGAALVICAGPMPKDDAPWGLPPAALKALGPKPCVVGMNARGVETMEQIMAFANEKRGGRPLWLAALVGFSAGCQQVRRLWRAGASALALVLADGLHAHNPPDPYQMDYARDIVARARLGAICTIVEHTYIQVAPDVTSASEMARTVTGWPLPPPPLGETVRRVEAVPPGSPRWAGLVVYSTGSGTYDKPAHEAQALRALPLALAGRVRELVELPTRPAVADVVPSAAPPVTPEPRAEVVLEPTGAPSTRPTDGDSLAPGAETILVVGDSLVQGLARDLEAEARDICKLHTTGVQSSRVHDWNGPRLTAALTSSEPALVLICLGANDAGTTNAAHAGTEAGALIDAILDTGAAVSWIAPPTMAHEDGTFRTALAQACASRGVKVLDTPALALPRTPDGIHVTPAGTRTWAAAIAQWVPFSAYSGHAAEAPQTGPAPSPGPLATVTPEPLHGRLEPWPPPFRPGETRRPLDPAASLGERAVWFSIDEQRAGVRSGDTYRRGQGKPGDPWDGYGFAYAGYSTALPGEVLPHAYTGLVSLLVRTGEWHPRRDGYTPRTGDGAVWGPSDPRTWPYGAKGGRIERVMAPDATTLGGPGAFTTIAADAQGKWEQRAHRVDEEGFQGWLAYPPKRVLLPAQIVVEGFGTLPLEDYVARVVTAELGGAREIQALAAQAMAARSYAVWMMQHEGWGTEAKPMPATERKQVVARVATSLCTQATVATRGGLVLHGERVVLTSYVAGAIWLRGAGTGEGGDDPTHTERYVTYNAGRVGDQVRPSRIASTLPDNRGCLSQNGAVALARQGVLWPGILTFFYGSDIAFTIAPPGSGPRPSPVGPPETKSSNAPLYVAAALAAYLWLS